MQKKKVFHIVLVGIILLILGFVIILSAVNLSGDMQTSIMFTGLGVLAVGLFLASTPRLVKME